MPEGHTVHRLAREHAATFRGGQVAVSSPQGRFAAGAARVDGRQLVATEAYGKHLFHGYDNELWVHVHLGLYGKFSPGGAPPPEPRGAVRMRMQADDAYTDLRGPTACEIVEPAGKEAVQMRLGPDPLRDDADPDLAWHRISRSRAPLGGLLMDQTVMAGIGNVYRAEVLYRARIDPYRSGRQLQEGEWVQLWRDLSRLMRAGVRAGRIVTTRPADRPQPGRPRREDSFYVYGRGGLPCRVCGTAVRREPLLGRMLHWCPGCQSR